MRMRKQMPARCVHRLILFLFSSFVRCAHRTRSLLSLLGALEREAQARCGPRCALPCTNSTTDSDTKTAAMDSVADAWLHGPRIGGTDVALALAQTTLTY
jgi:hypothetical protein